MRLGWNRFRRQHENNEHAISSAVNRRDDGQDMERAQHVAEEWAALSDAERADISAALVEQREVMDKYRITSFHSCERGGWNTPQSLIRSAETIRAQTKDMHAIFDTANDAR